MSNSMLGLTPLTSILLFSMPGCNPSPGVCAFTSVSSFLCKTTITQKSTTPYPHKYTTPSFTRRTTAAVAVAGNHVVPSVHGIASSIGDFTSESVTPLEDDDDDDEEEEEDVVGMEESPPMVVTASKKPLNGKKKRTTNVANLRKRTKRLLRLTASEEEKKKSGGQKEDDEEGVDEDHGEEEEEDPGFKITRGTFNNLIHYWLHSGHPEAIYQGEALLRRMEDIMKRDINGEALELYPDARSYTMVIQATAKTGGELAGEKADELLQSMIATSQSGKNSWAEPNMFTYTAAMEAWVASGHQDAAARAEDLLSSLRALYEEKCGNGDEQLCEQYRPGVRAFNAVINAWAKSNADGSAQRAEQNLSLMDELREANPRLYGYLRPNRINYNAVIHAWANSGEEGAAERSEELLCRMERLYLNDGDADLKPNVKSFNTVLDAWAKSESDGAALKAEGILDHMQHSFETGNLDVKPNVRSFNSVLNAWAKSKDKDAALHAERLLHYMESDVDSGADIRPDAHSFSTVINAWGRSHSFGKAERAKSILQHMCKLHTSGQDRKLQPNVVIFNSVMNACAFTMGDELERSRAMQIAHETFQELEKSSYGEPDQVTYGTFLKVCANQMEPGDARTAVVEAVFKKCCKDGQVGDLVMRELQCMATDELCEKLLGEGVKKHNLSRTKIPYEWKRNVNERRTYSYNRSRRRRGQDR